MASVLHGKGYESSMGLTPLEGLVMGTRCGSIDPSMAMFLTRNAGYTPDQLDKLFNKESGLLGMCGTNDMRQIIAMMDQAQDLPDQARLAKLAYDVFVYKCRQFVGSYAVSLGAANVSVVDAIVFSGGIGENSSRVRHDICHGLQALRGFIPLDYEKNSISKQSQVHAGVHAWEVNVDVIGHDDACIRLLVVPTDEEAEMAIQMADEIALECGGASGMTE